MGAVARSATVLVAEQPVCGGLCVFFLCGLWAVPANNHQGVAGRFRSKHNIDVECVNTELACDERVAANKNIISALAGAESALSPQAAHPCM